MASISGAAAAPALLLTCVLPPSSACTRLTVTVVDCNTHHHHQQQQQQQQQQSSKSTIKLSGLSLVRVVVNHCVTAVSQLLRAQDLPSPNQSYTVFTQPHCACIRHLLQVTSPSPGHCRCV
jgi:hypothetical protein